MLNLKRAAIIGSMLAALSVSAYAADNNAENLETASMKDRVQTILNQDNPNMHGNKMDRRYYGPRDGKHMGPKGEMRGPRHDGKHGPRHMMSAEEREKWDKMTPAEREEAAKKHRAEMEKKRAEWEKMTPEQRQKAMEKHQAERKAEHDKRAKEAMNKLTDAQKAEVEQFIKEDIAQREARKEKLKNMTQEQREAVRLNMPRKHNGPRFNGEHR